MKKSALSIAAELMGRPGRAKLQAMLRAMTPEQRSTRMKAVINARWHPQKPKEGGPAE